MTKQSKKSPALSQTLDEFIQLRERQEFLAKVMAGLPMLARDPHSP